MKKKIIVGAIVALFFIANFSKYSTSGERGSRR